MGATAFATDRVRVRRNVTRGGRGGAAAADDEVTTSAAAFVGGSEEEATTWAVGEVDRLAVDVAAGTGVRVQDQRGAELDTAR